MLSYHKGHGPYLRRVEGSLLRSVSSMLHSERAGMGPADDLRGILVALERIRDLDLLRPQPTLHACLRSRATILEIFSQSISVGTCPLLLSIRVRRNYSKGARSPDYFLDFSYVPKFRNTTVRMLAARCPSYSALASSADALLGEVRSQELSDGPSLGNSLVHKSQARHWCRRNNSPCLVVCGSLSRGKSPDRATYSLEDWPDPVPDRPDVETAFQNAMRDLRSPVHKGG